MKHLITHPNICSKRWIYEQYDSMVGTRNMGNNFPSDAAIVNIKESEKALALTVDCNPRYVNADPEIGAAIAVAEAARNIVCSGGIPIAITNCLNFGNPYNPEVYWQFVGAIKGMSAACIKFNTPVTGGNVSFYNQVSHGKITESVFPTPTIGMLGLLEDKNNIMTLDFKNEGDVIFLLGDSKDDIACSEYLYSFVKTKHSPAPYFNLDEEYNLHQAVIQIIKNKLIQSAHDCSDGGLFICLLECAMPRCLGFDISTDPNFRTDAFLFGEAQGRIVVSVKPEDLDKFFDFMISTNVEFSNIGVVQDGDVYIDDEGYGTVYDVKNSYENAIYNAMK